MKRPSFQFYPADWRNNANLRRCSPAARGVWMDVLCLLHDSDEYGVLRWPLADIAQAAGVPMELLRELVEKRVLKGGDAGCEAFFYVPRHAGRLGEPAELLQETQAPCWFCGRMVRDEFMRGRRGVGTRFGAGQEQPKPTKAELNATEPVDKSPEPSPSRREGDGATSTSSSTSTSSKDMCVFVGAPPLFDDGHAVPLPAHFPDRTLLDAKLVRAGRPPPTPGHLQTQLVAFGMHYVRHRMSVYQWHTKLFNWLLRNPETGEDNHAGTPTHQRRPGQDQKRQHSGFAAGDAISERWARGADG